MDGDISTAVHGGPATQLSTLDEVLKTRRYVGLRPPTSSSSGGDLGALWAPKYSTVQYNTLQNITVHYSTLQYSTVQEDGVRGWITPYSTLCGVSVTGAASVVAECGTNILFKKCQKSLLKNPFLGHFQKSVTGSKSMCRFVMASSYQKLY